MALSVLVLAHHTVTCTFWALDLGFGSDKSTRGNYVAYLASSSEQALVVHNVLSSSTIPQHGKLKPMPVDRAFDPKDNGLRPVGIDLSRPAVPCAAERASCS